MIQISCRVPAHGSFLVPKQQPASVNELDAEQKRIEILEDCARFLRSCTCGEFDPVYLKDTDTQEVNEADRGFIEYVFMNPQTDKRG